MHKVLAGLLLAASVAAEAQEGFPLDGTWRGERQAAGETPITLVIVMQWDGKQVTGIVNPGPKSLQLTDAQLVPDGWRVTLATQNAKGEPVKFEGSIQDLGSYQRHITGKWTEGGRSYDVRLQRE
jgi:hypothetical protein